MQRFRRSVLLFGASFLVLGCSESASTTVDAGSGTAPAVATDAIEIDGSSTVFPITAAIAETYQASETNAPEVTVSFSGTGGGFDKFCAGETDINGASRPIAEDEIAACDAAGIRYIELPIAFDALTVVVNQQNDWAEDITVEELAMLWEASAQGDVTQWNQIRSSWPDRPIALYGPGSDSGTYDYFTEVIIGGESRSDYVASEDDELLAMGVAQNPNALGYFGLAYFDEYQADLRAVAIDNGQGPVAPSVETVVNAEYQPLARPLFIYVNFAAAQKNPAVRNFVQFYLEEAPSLVAAVGYIPLTEEGYHIAWVNFQEGEAGTAFDGKPQPNLTIAELLRKTKRF